MNGAASVEPDGSFTFTPVPGFIGWAEFKYREVGGAVSQDVFVLVGAVPYPLMFEKYKYKRWLPALASLLGTW